MQYTNFMNQAFEEINQHYTKNETLGKYLVPSKSKLSINEIETIVSKIKIVKFDCDIAGVDSGFVSKRLSFLDILLIKIGAVIFSYNDSKLTKAEYFKPTLFPEPILLKNGLENDEEEQSKGIERLKKEITTSIELIIEKKPKYLFIDGSIIPQYQNKPRSDSKIKDDYESIIDLFQKLYKTSEENNCTLISTVEDSRGNRFKEVLIDSLKLNEEQLKFASDSSILDYILINGERTCFFNYSKNIEKHSILKEYTKDWSNNIYVFYLKASNYDKALRIEFIAKKDIKEKANEIASIVYQLSSLHKDYSYPSILIEADMRARLTNEEIEIVFNKLIDKIGPKLNLRRGNRPFK
ncbi:MAG: DNA double-strand break repair nuclease NurA [Candidatus ainarchaeum sp.]|nr:DNA double-strand break repair nuclease NurA [Candidatus ainarchaeum sp.]